MVKIAVYAYLPARGGKPFYCGQSVNPEAELRARLRKCRNHNLGERLRRVGVRVRILSWHRTEKAANRAEARAVREFKTHESLGGCNRTKDGAGLFPIRDREEHLQWSKEGGHCAGQIAFEQGVGIHAQTPEEHALAGAISGRFTVWKKLGIHAMTPKQYSTIGRLAVKKKIGIHAQSREERAAFGRSNGRIAVKDKTGIHAHTSQEHAFNGRISGQRESAAARLIRDHLRPRVLKLRARGWSYRKIVRVLRVGYGTLWRTVNEKKWDRALSRSPCQAGSGHQLDRIIPV